MRKIRKISHLIVVGFLILSCLLGLFPVTVEKASAYIIHAPIRIDSNSDFANQAVIEGWAGSGTQWDPYIIENYDINGSGYGNCIYIGNTTVHFRIRDCYFHHASGNPYYLYWDAGLVLYYVQNGRVENNLCNFNYAAYGSSICSASKKDHVRA